MMLVFNGNDYHKAAFINSANALTGGLFQSSNNITQYFHLIDVNHDLMRENAKLRSDAMTERAQHEAPDTLDIKDTTARYAGRFVYIPADVISNSTAQRNNYLMLNAGTEDGVTKQCGVISDGGIVGIVYDVSAHYCTVISVLNSNTHISTKIDATNNAGTLTWNGRDPREAQIDDINNYVKVEAGQTLSTSGFNSIFPRNVPVGKIREFTVESYFNSIKVSLATNFETLRYVYIVKNLDLEEQEKLKSSIK